LKDENLIVTYKKLSKFKIEKMFKDITIAFFLRCSIEELIKILEVLESYDLGQFNLDKTQFLLNIPDEQYVNGIPSLKTKNPKTVWKRLNFERKNIITTDDMRCYCFY
jgi:hypothetical protein